MREEAEKELERWIAEDVGNACTEEFIKWEVYQDKIDALEAENADLKAYITTLLK